MTHELDLDHDLDQLFAAARAEPMRPGDGLTTRVLDDAARIQDGLVGLDMASARPRPESHPGGWWRQIALALGGWAGLGGLATACAAGVWIGFAPPSDWPDPVALVFESQGQSDLDLFQGEDMAALLGLEEGDI